VLIPGGYVTAAYDPVFKLSPDRKRCLEAPSTVATALGAPGLPFSLVFRADPGRRGCDPAHRLGLRGGLDAADSAAGVRAAAGLKSAFECRP